MDYDLVHGYILYPYGPSCQALFFNRLRRGVRLCAGLIDGLLRIGRYVDADCPGDDVRVAIRANDAEYGVTRGLAFLAIPAYRDTVWFYGCHGLPLGMVASCGGGVEMENRITVHIV